MVVCDGSDCFGGYCVYGHIDVTLMWFRWAALVALVVRWRLVGCRWWAQCLLDRRGIYLKHFISLLFLLLILNFSLFLSRCKLFVSGSGVWGGFFWRLRRYGCKLALTASGAVLVVDGVQY